MSSLTRANADGFSIVQTVLSVPKPKTLLILQYGSEVLRAMKTRKLPRDVEVLCRGIHLEFVRAPNGWEYVQHQSSLAGVLILAVTDDGRLLLVEQIRPPLRGTVIELPAGLIDEREEPESAARRELEEETGYQCDSIKEVCKGSTSPGLTNDQNIVCVASGLRRIDESRPDERFADGSRKHLQIRGLPSENEELVVWEVPLTSVVKWLFRRRLDGTILDLRIFAGLFFLGVRPPE